ncbi:MAG: hypothetical protein CMN87_20350 [Stappia sp.]|uniref:DUF2293 domain-containing protein n=1 Tax=Stappia sp. TaxID=1870903 RepID=UPI000C3F3D45|nr:DUF2293 domain-containing protein [Stappia sp.]MAA98018.1 hypothetical protein [Stappia sp.]MBM22359.1 hypothetical protein [Stappia sp.]|tara:strand:+ start:56 stop:427 length:372 start_codon:yes stop_codon:yes gene_type:complete
MAGGTKRSRDMRLALRRLIPLAPLADAAPILEAALARHLKHLPPSVALWLAVTSHVRHRHTGYEAMLVEGYDRDSARFFVVDEMNAVLTRWGSKRLVDADEETFDEAEPEAGHALETPSGDQR